MNVQAVQVMEYENSLGQDKVSLPTTFFHLDNKEQEQYTRFLERYHSIREFFAQYKQGMSPQDERIRREQELQTLFFSIINPYLECSGLQTVWGGTTYGPRNEFTTTTPRYSLFKEKKFPFNIGVELNYTFHTEPERLTATARVQFSQTTESQRMKSVIDDLIKKLLASEQGDGIAKPLLFCSSIGWFYGSTDFGMPLAYTVAKMLSSIGADNMNDLCIIKGGCLGDCDYDGIDKEKARVIRPILEKAYKERLEQEVLKSGLKTWEE